MTAKEYLKKYRWAVRSAKRIQCDINNITSDSISMSSAALDIRVQSSPNGDTAMVNTVNSIDKKRKKLLKQQYYFEFMARDILNSISAVKDDRERAVLEYKYIDGMTLAQAAEAMNYSERHIFRVHKAALSHIVIPPKYKDM